MKKKNQGFTLIELMVVIAIVGVLMAIAGPAFGDFIKRQKIRSIVNEWQNSFFFAQREAMRLKRPLKMCATTDGATCKAPNGEYTQGWIIIDERNNNKILQDTIMSEQDGLVMRLDGNDYLKANGFRFLSNGRMQITGESAYLVICSTKKSSSNPQASDANDCNKEKAFDKKVYVITQAGRLTGKKL